MVERPKLSYILKGRDNLDKVWDNTEPADEFRPLSAGEYECHWTGKDLFTARSGTPGCKLTFAVIEGEHAGRKVFLDLWLTAAAMQFTRRDFNKLGVTSLEQLESPLLTDKRIRIRAKVALRTSDAGGQFNVVRSFEVTGVDAVEADPFAPAPGGEQ